MSVAEVNEISVRYENTEVFKNITFKIERGDFIALSGPNGSGKSTLVKSILGLTKISSGNIKILGHPLEKFDQWHKIGYVPQRLNLSPFFPASVYEVVKMGLQPVKKLSIGEKIKRISNALNLLGIENIKEKNIAELSGGQFQKVIISRAIVSEPEFLILDEPTTALDPETREKFFEIISYLNQEKKTTVVLVTHDTGNAGKYAKKLMYFDRKIVFYGTFEDFCKSDKMSNYFGYGSQHIICHRH
ncbi:MAG: metal ABC transporter ATP-binding protein [Proteobacteria bacterium]|nr:metal ABC transporter ATP-binding protein [Pseudomonadota bacterium]